MSQIQLLKETSGEKWEERRVLLLKAQNFQLEEQVTNLLDSAAQRNDLIRDMSLCARALQLRIKDLKVPGLESAGEALEALEREAQRLEVKAFSAATRRLALPEEFVDPMQARTLTSKLLFSSHKGFPPFLKLDRVNTLEHSLANLIPDLEGLYLLVVQHPMFLSSHFSGTTSKKFNLKRISALIKSLKTAISQLGDLSALLPSRSPPPAQVSRSASASKVVAILEDLASSKTTTRLPKDGKEQRNAIGKLARLAKSEEKAAVARVHRGEKEIAKYQRYAAALLAGSQSLQTALRKIDEAVLRLGSGDVRKELKELATPLDPKLFEDSGAYEHVEIDRKNRIDHLADTLEGIEPYVQTIFRRFDVVMREHAIEMGRDENEEKVRES